MQRDTLQLLNTRQIARIARMNDDELWNFLLENEERIKFLTDFENKSRPYPVSGFLYAYPHGIDWFKKHFLKHVEEYREGVIFSTTMDFCFEDETVYLDYWTSGGHLDNQDSCDVKTSDEIMPPVNERSEEGQYKIYFHLLEAVHIENIIRAMEKNFDKLDERTRQSIDRAKEMKKICAENEDYRAAYIYSYF
jgi:hypothetical protein